jgi:SAM-dependent methyltransferase
MEFKSRVPKSMKAMARPVVWRVSDAMASIRGELLPPRRLVSQVPGNFQQVGSEFLGHVTTLGGLLPDKRVLDIGCGPGRIAIPLTGYLSAGGSYEGVDTWSEAVDWCSAHITPRFDNFRFTSLGVGANGGKFPFADAEFDCAVLCAISRLDETTFRSYLLEAGRLLRSGGVYFGTCFLSYDPDPDDPGHDHRKRPASRSSSSGPQSPFVFSEEDIETVLATCGLRIESVHRGAWAGHPSPLSYQDVIVAIKA